MKRKAYTILGILLILTGLLIAALPYYQSYVMQRQSQSLTDIIDELSAEELQENTNNEATYEWDLIENISFDDFNPVQEVFTDLNIIAESRYRLDYNRDGSFKKDQIIGQIVIPELQINLTLFSGITNGNLLYGVANMKANQVMGQKNYAIAGHIAHAYNTLFTHLPKAKKGMIVRLTDKNNIYYYKIFETKEVDVNAVYMVENHQAEVHGKPIISLMSCIPNKKHMRFFAVGELVSVQPYTKDAMITQDADPY